jgi:phage terminase large subunit
MLNSDICKEITKKGYAKERIRADAAEPKSNAELRHLGLTRLQKSVKGKDSIMFGISAIQEYKIYIHPKCINFIAEISSYCFAKDKFDKPLNQPEDDNNHLMDAMRYAFYDVRYFNPTPPQRQRLTPQQQINKTYAVKPNDMKGGWI